jgi:glycosyltransferase involved in cell wall biosynthesis
MEMNDVTVGVKSFFRPQKLEICLESLVNADFEFSEVLIVDDGKISEDKQEVYDYYSNKLPMTVYDLEFDHGLAASRNKLVEEMNGDYLLLLDDDIAVPRNIDHLKLILEKCDSLGGIAGLMYEDGDYKAIAHDLVLRDNLLGRTLVRDISSNKIGSVDSNIGTKTFYKYDFIPNCALFKKTCLEDVSWDPEYKIEREHIDFYLQHKETSQWEFGLTEEVVFGHYPGGDIDFERNRNSELKHRNSEEYFKRKWDIDRVVSKDKHYYTDEGIIRALKNSLKQFIPP